MPSTPTEKLPSRHKAIVVARSGYVDLEEVDMPKLGPKQILVQVGAASQSSCDWDDGVDGLAFLAGQTMVYAKKYGAVAGCNFAGTVMQIGPDVPENQWTVGDRVAGFVHGGLSSNGSFAEYVVAFAHIAVHIPSNWSLEDASQLGIAPFTACQYLYHTHNFHIPSELKDLPAKPDGDEREMLLVYGGATSVGLYTIQLAKLSGLRVFAACAPRHFDLLREYGADEVFDYTNPQVSMRIGMNTYGKLKYAVDIVAERQSPYQVSRSLSREGGKVASCKKYASPRPGVEVHWTFPFTLLPENCDYPAPYTSIEEERDRGQKYAQMISDVIANGSVKPIPAFILPDGLASVAQGLEMMMEGNTVGTTVTYRISDTPGIGIEAKDDVLIPL